MLSLTFKNQNSYIWNTFFIGQFLDGETGVKPERRFHSGKCIFYDRFNVKNIFRNKFWFMGTHTDELRQFSIWSGHGLQEEKQALLSFEISAGFHAAVCANKPVFMLVFFVLNLHNYALFFHNLSFHEITLHEP